MKILLAEFSCIMCQARNMTKPHGKINDTMTARGGAPLVY